MTGGWVGGHGLQFARQGQMSFTKFIKVDMYVDKRGIFFLSPLTGLSILAKPVHSYGR